MINVNRTESFLKQQINCLEILTELIAFDKEHGNPPETARGFRSLYRYPAQGTGYGR